MKIRKKNKQHIQQFSTRVCDTNQQSGEISEMVFFPSIYCDSHQKNKHNQPTKKTTTKQKNSEENMDKDNISKEII